MPTITDGIAGHLKGMPKDVALELLERLVGESEQAVEDRKADVDDLSGSTIEELTAEMNGYDHFDKANYANSPGDKRHKAVTSMLDAKMLAAHQQTQQVTMDRQEYIEMDLRRGMLSDELNKVQSMIQTPATEARRHELVAELNTLIEPDVITSPPPEVPEKTPE